jgi:hypothetical protein
MLKGKNFEHGTHVNEQNHLITSIMLQKRIHDGVWVYADMGVLICLAKLTHNEVVDGARLFLRMCFGVNRLMFCSMLCWE